MNTNWDNGTQPTNGLRLHLNLDNKSVSILQTLSSNGIYTDSQGAFWPLDNGNTLMGYGAIAKIKEYGPDGKERMNLQFGIDNLVQSYRTYRQVWNATPAAPPKAVIQDRAVYMSWNGATNVTQWAVYVGNTTSQMKLVGMIPKKGFETSINLTNTAAFAQVAAYFGDQFLQKSAVVSVIG